MIRSKWTETMPQNKNKNKKKEKFDSGHINTNNINTTPFKNRIQSWNTVAAVVVVVCFYNSPFRDIETFFFSLLHKINWYSSYLIYDMWAIWTCSFSCSFLLYFKHKNFVQSKQNKKKHENLFSIHDQEFIRKLRNISDVVTEN